MKIASILFFGLCLVAVKAAATTGGSEFLDKDAAKPTEPSTKEPTTTERLHKVVVNRNEVIEDGNMKQFNVSINPAKDEGISTTEAASPTTLPDVTTKTPATVKPTTSAVPLDDHTTAKAKVTTEKAQASTPAPVISESHLLKWIVAGIFCGVFVVMLSLYAYKFYVHRTESSYQNL